MTNSTTAANSSRSVGDPCARYESLKPLWRIARGILNGQAHARALDRTLDTVGFSNILLPFSPTMTPEQYRFYLAESELPGLSSQYIRVLSGGMLRKQPDLELLKDAPEGALDWLRHNFCNGMSMSAFLDMALNEELQTSRCWIMVDHPDVDMTNMDPEERKNISPYPIIVNAESVINWREGPHPVTGKNTLLFVAVRNYKTKFNNNKYHPDYVESVKVHKLNEEGNYIVEEYELRSSTSSNIEFINSVPQQNYFVTGGSSQSDSNWDLVRTYDNILANNKPLDFIPATPLNGNVDGDEPMLMPLIDREVALYNKVSRRNHLLLGSATYTPVVCSDMTDDSFEEIVSKGLGSWIKVGTGDEVKALETPSKALKDMETVIQNTISEMARLGIRMMTTEGKSSRESGVSLEIRNAGQSAILSSLSHKVSQQMRKVIMWMINWKYDTKYKIEDIKFNLTPDLNPAPLGADWIRLVTEWYQAGIIPRSTFLDIAKANDIIDTDYDDEMGKKEIDEDDLIISPQEVTNGLDSTVNPTEPEKLGDNNDD